jgi:hypothetical protein
METHKSVTWFVTALLLKQLCAEAQVSNNVLNEPTPVAELEAVMISTFRQRYPVYPIILYVKDSKWSSRFSRGNEHSGRGNPRDPDSALGEQTDRSVLRKLRAEAEPKEHSLSPGYGNCQMEFYRSDGKRQTFLMSRTDTTAVIESVRKQLSTNSIALNFIELINRFVPGEPSSER